MKAVGSYFDLVAGVTHLFYISRLVVRCQHCQIPYEHLRTPLGVIPEMTLHDIFVRTSMETARLASKKCVDSPLPD